MVQEVAAFASLARRLLITADRGGGSKGSRVVVEK